MEQFIVVGAFVANAIIAALVFVEMVRGCLND